MTGGTDDGNATGARPLFLFGDAVPHAWRALMVGPHIQAVFAKDLISRQRDAVAFAGRRCEAERELAIELCAAETAGDFCNAWLEFWQEAMVQYLTEARMLAETSTGALDLLRTGRHEAEGETESAASEAA